MVFLLIDSTGLGCTIRFTKLEEKSWTIVGKFLPPRYHSKNRHMTAINPHILMMWLMTFDKRRSTKPPTRNRLSKRGHQPKL